MTVRHRKGGQLQAKHGQTGASSRDIKTDPKPTFWSAAWDFVLEYFLTALVIVVVEWPQKSCAFLSSPKRPTEGGSGKPNKAYSNDHLDEASPLDSTAATAFSRNAGAESSPPALPVKPLPLIADESELERYRRFYFSSMVKSSAVDVVSAIF
jgi:hypothetical protein